MSDDGTETTWTRRATMTRGGAIALALLLGGSLALMIGLALGTDMQGAEFWIMWGTVLLLAPVTILTYAMTRFTVRIDVTGFEVASPIGWPKKSVPADQIRSVQVVEVNPLGEFGGWGWRFGASGEGFVLRKGEGLRIGRQGKGDLTVTVDDAEDAAALLREHARLG